MATERVCVVFWVWGFWQGSVVVLGDVGIFRLWYCVVDVRDVGRSFMVLLFGDIWLFLQSVYKTTTLIFIHLYCINIQFLVPPRLFLCIFIHKMHK